MPSVKTADPNSAFRQLPSVDALLRSRAGRQIALEGGEAYAAAIAREVIDELRGEIGESSDANTKTGLLDLAASHLLGRWQRDELAGMRRVINATGVIVHTNLGRAPLSQNALLAITEAALYCTLEYDLDTGKRGRRAPRAEQLVAELTGAESV